MMQTFITTAERQTENLDWGSLVRLSGPRKTGADQLVVIEVNLAPGGGHTFHKHPRQEEIIYVISGVVEQWVDGDKKDLAAGESAYIPANVVHASFNKTSTNAKFLAILGPCIGEDGYELVEI